MLLRGPEGSGGSEAQEGAGLWVLLDWNENRTRLFFYNKAEKTNTK